MLAGNLLTALIEGSFRILSGTVKSAWGYLVSDGVLAAGGQFERLNGHASLVRVRAGTTIRRLPPGA